MRNIGILIISCACQSFSLLNPTYAQSDEKPLLDLVTECDVLAAHPDDPQRMAEGVTDDRIVPRLAALACERALKSDDGDPRFSFQMGRALSAAGKRADAFDHLKRAADAGHAAASAYLGDAYQFGYGVPIDLAKALAAYKAAEAGGFTPAETQIEQITFDKSIFALDVLGLVFERKLPDLARQSDEVATKRAMRSYVFSLSQRFISECGKALTPANVVKLYRYRFGGDWTNETDAPIDVSIQNAIGEVDANTFLRRHGCEGAVARHVFGTLDSFLSARQDS